MTGMLLEQAAVNITQQILYQQMYPTLRLQNAVIQTL